MKDLEKTLTRVPEVMKTVGYIRRHLNKVLSVLSEYPDDAEPFALEEEEMLFILNELEKCDMGIRANMEESYFDESDNQNNTDSLAYKDLPVEVTYKDNILHISCPMTLNRKYQEAHFLGNCVEMAMKVLEQKQGKEFSHQMDLPWFILIVRHVPSDNHSVFFRDNDHMEEANIINRIKRLFFISDGKDAMQFSSICVCTDAESPYTEIFAYDFNSYDKMTSYIKNMLERKNNYSIRKRKIEKLREMRDAKYRN